MSRTVAAMYDTRPEAELARGRLAAEARPKAVRIISKDTAAALDGLKIARADADAYREGLLRGGHLLVAEVPSGANAKRIIELLEQSAGEAVDENEERAWAHGEEGVQVKLPADSEKEPPEAVSDATRETPPAEPAEPAPPLEQPLSETEPEVPVANKDLPVAGGARVRSITRDAPAEEQVSLQEEIITVENRSSERRLSDEELEKAGVFKERVFEVAQMREEPVVTKVAVVREEVIVRKTLRERTETIRDTVRQTAVEVEDLPAPEDRPTFFKAPR